MLNSGLKKRSSSKSVEAYRYCLCTSCRTIYNCDCFTTYNPYDVQIVEDSSEASSTSYALDYWK